MESCQIKLAGELAWARAGGSRGADRDRGILDPTQFSPTWDLFFPLSVPLSLLPSLHHTVLPTIHLRSILSLSIMSELCPVISLISTLIHIAVVIRFALPFFYHTLRRTTSFHLDCEDAIFGRSPPGYFYLCLCTVPDQNIFLSPGISHAFLFSTNPSAARFGSAIGSSRGRASFRTSID